MGTWIAQNITLPLSVTVSEEKENSVSHFAGLLLALIGLVCVIQAQAVSGHPSAKSGMIIFAIMNVVLYASSAFYHFLEPGIPKKLFRVLDHSSIYLLIAGSYTPILLYIGSETTIAYAIGMWIAAAAGIILTIRFWGRFYPLHIAMYAVMGWSILSIHDSVFPYIPDGLFPYVLSGGITYTIGILFYSIRKIPHNHLIWHIFVLIGSLFFFLGYYLTLLA